jgi:hypothetical protein
VIKFTLGAPHVKGGYLYSFKVNAINFNGLGPDSAVYNFSICIVPSGLFPPNMTAVLKTSMVLTWNPPTSDGGCPVTSYHIFMDDGNGGALTEI